MVQSLNQREDNEHVSQMSSSFKKHGERKHSPVEKGSKALENVERQPYSYLNNTRMQTKPNQTKPNDNVATWLKRTSNNGNLVGHHRRMSLEDIDRRLDPRVEQGVVAPVESRLLAANGNVFHPVQVRSVDIGGQAHVAKFLGQHGGPHLFVLVDIGPIRLL